MYSSYLVVSDCMLISSVPPLLRHIAMLINYYVIIN